VGQRPRQLLDVAERVLIDDAGEAAVLGGQAAAPQPGGGLLVGVERWDHGLPFLGGHGDQSRVRA